MVVREGSGAIAESGKYYVHCQCLPASFPAQASMAYLQGSNGQALYYYEEAVRISEQNKGVRAPTSQSSPPLRYCCHLYHM